MTPTDSNRRVWKWLACALLWLPLSAASTAQAATVLEQKMAEMAVKFSAAIKGLGHDSVSIGAFTAPPQLDASTGPGIAKLLADEFARQEISVKRRAEFGLKGEFRDARNEQGRLTARIDGELVDRSGNVVFTYSTDINGAGELSSLLGLTVELPADKPEKQREQKVAEAIEKPKADIRQTRVSASSTSPYSIELLVKSGDDYQPRSVTLDEGVPFVPVARQEIYGVRLINDSPLDAAVTLTIDGVNVFAFSQNKEYKHYIIKRKSSGLIKGWHRTNQVADSFQVGEFSKSPAASLLPAGGVIGTITASFAAAWGVNEPAPADELSARLASRGGQDATIIGPPTSQELTEVHRHTGSVRAVVSLRYSKPDDLPPGEAPK